MRFVRALLAAVVLAALVVGIPLALIHFIGNPWPAEGVSLSAPLTDGAIVGLLATVVWILWAQVTACILAEAVAVLRGDREGARVPLTLGVQQAFARRLITALVIAGVSAPGSAALAQASVPVHTPAAPTVSVPTVAAVASDPSTVTHSGSVRSDDPTAVTVMRLDSLWSIAERVLGDGERWTEIAALNEGRSMSDGSRFAADSPIHPGWELLVPADAHTQAPHEVTVRSGDTLSAIAEKHLGDASKYPEIMEASDGIHQPGGAVLKDPDLIQPGWTVRIPGPGGEAPRPVAEVEEAAPRPDSAPAPSPAVPDVVVPDLQTHDPEPETAPVAEPTVEHDDKGSQVGTKDEGQLALQALLATATCLAAGAFVMVVRNRRRQFKQRGIGRAIAPTTSAQGVTEETVVEAGLGAQPDAEFVDRALRYVAATCVARSAPLPHLSAAVLGPEDLTLLLDEAAEVEAPDGWSNTGDNQAWMLPRDTYLEDTLDSQPAPYPALVTVGRDSAGRTWMLDLEARGTVGIAGDAEQAEALIRFVVAELAVNAWAEGTEVLVGEPFADTVGINPGRVRTATRAAAMARAQVIAQETEDATAALGADVLKRRAEGLVLDTTTPLVVVVSADRGEALRERISPAARSRAVVIHDDPEAASIVLSPEGIAFVPRWNVSLTALTMTNTQAGAMAELLAATRTYADVPVDDGDDDGVLGHYAKVDGTLREEFRMPRASESEDPSSLLPHTDATYLERTATTTGDLAEIAPGISTEVADEIDGIDPGLDEDLAAWLQDDSPRPKVRVLGPVEVSSANGGDSSTLSNLAGTISFIAFLACRDRGVTGEAVAAAFGWETQRTVQNRASNARRLLGVRSNGTDWLPDASKTDSARRGNPTYELDRGCGGVLIDADLFRRLRFRATKRGTAGGQQDLLTALSLVRGAPFEAATDRRYPWLFRGQRLDDVMVCAIEDVAHVVATRALADGDHETARFAASVAQQANPHGDAAWLDLAAALDASEGTAAAEALLRTRFHAEDEDLAPRTEMVLDQREWMAS